MEIIDKILKKEKEVPKKEEIPKDWHEILSDCVVRIDILERQIAKLYKRQQGKAPTMQNPEVMYENDRYKILKDGRYIVK